MVVMTSCYPSLFSLLFSIFTVSTLDPLGCFKLFCSMPEVQGGSFRENLGLHRFYFPFELDYTRLE